MGQQCSKWGGVRWELSAPMTLGEGTQGCEVRGRRTGEEVRGRKGKDTGKERGENGRGAIPVFRGWRINKF